jgi:hypothetical protein
VGVCCREFAVAEDGGEYAAAAEVGVTTAGEGGSAAAGNMG